MNVKQLKALESLEFETGYLDAHNDPGTRFAPLGALAGGIGDITISYLVDVGYAIAGVTPSGRKGYRITDAGKAALADL